MRELQGPDVRQVSPTPAPEPRVAGGVVVYRLYDVGYEIDLERAMSLLAAGPGEPAALRLALPHPDHPAEPVAADRPLERRSAREIGRATSELQSHSDLVCRLLLEKKKNKRRQTAMG